MPDQSDVPDDRAREIKRLRRELARADRDRIRLERERDRLQRENERLQQELDLARRAAQYQEELPEVRPLVRRFDVAIGRCRACGRRLQGRHPLQTSNALGAAGVQLGPQAVALMVQLNKQLGLSHGKIATLLRDRFAVAVTSSTVTRALHRAARQARPTYVALCETIRGSPVVAPDETSWRVNGHSHWLWAFATPETTVYAIQPGRGFAQAAGILGAEYAGVLVRDGWAPYRQFTAAAHHTCLAHLLRRCRDLRQDHPRAQFARRVQAALQQALRIRDRRDAGTISRHGAAVARGHVTTRLHTALDHVGPLPAMRRFAAHLSVELPALFSFLFDPAVDATNWRAEQALRPAVVNRKVSGGNRTARGAVTQQVLTSVLRTAQQRHLDASAILVDLLSAPHSPLAPTTSSLAQKRHPGNQLHPKFPLFRRRQSHDVGALGIRAARGPFDLRARDHRRIGSCFGHRRLCPFRFRRVPRRLGGNPTGRSPRMRHRGDATNAPVGELRCLVSAGPSFVPSYSRLRIIPLDGTLHVSDRIRGWMGDSRGHWEGETLVIETTNFDPKGWISSNASAGRLSPVKVATIHEVTHELVSSQRIGRSRGSPDRAHIG